ncbi:hypothetical protein SUGI_1181810 [Cryptomeria japonica]|nr:hypothetical protein SUGI_1181810 [Cryptomeria japonica]
MNGEKIIGRTKIYTNWDAQMEKRWVLKEPQIYVCPSKCHDRNTIRWKTPPRGWTKLNFNSASKGNLGESSIGAIIWDEQGNVLHGLFGDIGVARNNEAKIRALEAGLCLCGRQRISRVIIEFENYLPSDTEDDGKEEGNEDGEDHEDSTEDDENVDSDTIREMAHREVWKEECERLKIFGENAWEVFRCVVLNGNTEPFRRVTESDDWWLLENSTYDAINIGEFAIVIYQAIGGSCNCRVVSDDNFGSIWIVWDDNFGSLCNFGSICMENVGCA